MQNISLINFGDYFYLLHMPRFANVDGLYIVTEPTTSWPRETCQIHITRKGTHTYVISLRFK